METVPTPRAVALAISARTSAEPTPWPCHESATTTPISVVRAPLESARSAAMAWPMMPPSLVASTAWVLAQPPDSTCSMAGVGVTAAKNLR